jgi:diguanylate cyclase (GGDEF)-like protein
MHRDVRHRHLVVRFALLALAAFLAVGALLHVVVARQVIEEHQAAAQFHAVFAVDNVLRPLLVPADLEQPVTGERYAQLRGSVVDQLITGPVRRVKVWALDGTVLFSDEPSIVGQRYADQAAELREAAEAPRSDVSDLSDEENVGERGLATSMFETYVPFSFGTDVVVVELYQDYGPTQAAAARFLRTLDASLLGGLLLLYALLLPIAYRTSRYLRRQAAGLRRQADLLSHAAFHDPLTNLANRSLFRDRLDHAIARADRSGRLVAVLFLDLDDFKAINDGSGHAAGDEVLVTVADRLRAVLRPQDTLARLGGDEFAVLLEDLSSADDAAVVAERIVAELSAPLTVNGRERSLGTSVGIALGGAGSNGDELTRAADLAMYDAKAAGKGRFEIFTPALAAASADRRELEADLRRAVADDEMVVHFQPVVALDRDTHSVVGVEALVRWNHPTRGLLAPGTFIGLAERTGLIASIGRYVLHEACRQVRQWQREHSVGPDFQLSVNVSAAQLSAGLADDVRAALAASGLDPRCLTLEITESVFVEDVDSAAAALTELKALGVSVAIDDFGTGYSSLAYLQTFPIDALKIDKSFVDRIDSSGRARELTQAIVKLAQALDLRIVAEGVERAEQLAPLRDLACDLAQGYYFDRPRDADAIGELLRTQVRHGVGDDALAHQPA